MLSTAKAYKVTYLLEVGSLCSSLTVERGPFDRNGFRSACCQHETRHERRHPATLSQLGVVLSGPVTIRRGSGTASTGARGFDLSVPCVTLAFKVRRGVARCRRSGSGQCPGGAHLTELDPGRPLDQRSMSPRMNASTAS